MSLTQTVEKDRSTRNKLRRYAVVGVGGRVTCFLDALAEFYRDTSEVVGFCDISQTRMDWHNQRRQQKYNAPAVATYRAEDFDKMVRETKPDTVIVSTMDVHHAQYIVRSMELGCDVICEKPMTINAEQTNAVLKAIEKTGKKLQVTFNMRFQPVTTRVKELIREGVIGKPLAVDVQWVLDTSHGADYFRRWHREKDKSGGLQIHKSTHHFDLINWFVDSYPRTVYAAGGLQFYGRENAVARGETERTEYARYSGVEAAANDPFALKIDGTRKPDDNKELIEFNKGLYFDAENDSGYIRDRNVFGDNITAEDTLSVSARYRNGVIFNYSLVAYSPWEGYRIAITGTKGRLELDVKYPHFTSDPEKGAKEQLRVYPMFAQAYDVKVPEAAGGHGGADPLLMDQLFGDGTFKDTLGQGAGHFDGAASVLIGLAVNESLRTGQVVNCDDLVKLP